MAQQFHIADLFETVAATVPDRVAISSDRGKITYRELDHRAQQLANGLARQGVARGDNVGLYLMNCPEYLESFLGIMKLGAVPFNVNYRYTAEELGFLFNDAKASAVIHGGEFSSVMDILQMDVPTLKCRIAVDNEAEADIGNSLSYAQMLETDAAGTFERYEDDLLLLYTGGTTGMPKGVMWPHIAFFYACLNGAGHFHPAGPIEKPAEIELRAKEGYQLKMFTLAPLMHGAAIWSAWSALLGGLTLVLDPMRSFDAEAIWDRVEKETVNIVQIVGDAMAAPLLDALKNNPGRWNLASVVNFGSGGAVFSQHLKDGIKEHLSNVMITDGMGASETGISGMAVPSDDGIMRLPCDDRQKLVLDDRFADVGETGLIARSGHTPIGYFGDPEKTAETFRKIEGRLWVVSGDRGRLDDDAMITMFGRDATCINSGGEKIFPEEVEEALRSHPSIFDVVVAGQPHDRWGESVTAILSRKTQEKKPTLDELKIFLSDKLSGYKIPKVVIWVDEVKRSPAGKQDYRWARDMAVNSEGEIA